jgi:anaerobic selenocysteine-containing dehydrogenase
MSIPNDWSNMPLHHTCVGKIILAGMKAFHDDPENNRLKTPSGKIEFYSQNLAKYFPDDQERPPVPHWIEKGETHDERVLAER